MKNSILIYSFFLAIPLFGQIPSEGLLLNMQLNGDLLDQTGNNSNITSTGASPTTDRDENPNSAYYFDGSNDYIQLPSNLKLTGAHTISFWCRPEAWKDLSGFFGGNSFGNSNTKGGIALGRFLNGGLYYDIYNTTQRNTVLKSSPNLELDVWTHITVSWDGTNEANAMKLYLGGELVETATGLSGPLNWSSYAFRLGHNYRTYYTGKIDEFLVYDRALSASEVMAIFSGPIELCGDGVQNGTETGVDCGGDCDPCATCSDGVQNGDETGIDCGGANCDECETTVAVESLWQVTETTLSPKDIDVNVGIGTDNALSKLSVVGDVGIEGNVKALEYTAATEIWPDYVFSEAYKIMSLEELEKYLKQNKHLPIIPTEAEVLKEGINLGKTDVLLLEKIEELTLYLIEQNKEIQALRLKVEKLERK